MKIHNPAMQFVSKEVEQEWNKGVEVNQDSYGNAVYRFASEWATRMEKEIESGKKVKDIAEKISHEADDEGITGFMYGCAVSILSQAWKYGEELRRWHNLDTQINNEGEKANEEGGVLNPALLNIE